VLGPAEPDAAADITYACAAVEYAGPLKAGACREEGRGEGERRWTKQERRGEGEGR